MKFSIVLASYTLPAQHQMEHSHSWQLATQHSTALSIQRDRLYSSGAGGDQKQS